MTTIDRTCNVSPEEFALAAKELAGHAAVAGDKAASRAIDSAALEYAMGVRPAYSAGDALIRSRTTAGVVYRLACTGVVWTCNCKAGQNGRQCWHSALMEVHDFALGIRPPEEDGYLAAPSEDEIPPINDGDLLGPDELGEDSAEFELEPGDWRWVLAGLPVPVAAVRARRAA